MAEMKRTVLALALLAAHASAAGSSASLCKTMDMVDNFRVTQPTNTDTRTVYRTTAATGTCNSASVPSSTSAKVEATKTTYNPDHTDAKHWTYADQENWDLYGASSECFAQNMLGTYPGESPINIVPTAATTTSDPVINMHDADKLRTGLPIFNNGHTVGYSMCPNKYDCSMTADFGTWPKKLRGITDDNNADEYFLLQFHWHWGSDDTKGSEHQICGNSRAAELHLVWVNRRNITSDRHDPESGLLLAVTGIMIEGGAAEDNAAWASLVDNVPTKAQQPGNGGTGVKVNVKDLLPADWDTKFYTYPGSLTTPPCSQVVSWFVFENFVKLSDAQLSKLRHAQMPAVGSSAGADDDDDEDSSGLSGSIIGLIVAACVVVVVGFIAIYMFKKESQGTVGTKKSPEVTNPAMQQRMERVASKIEA